MDDSRNINNVAVLLYGIMQQQKEKQSWWSLSEQEETDRTPDLNTTEQYGE